MKYSIRKVDIFTVICVSLALRAIVSLHSYSGQGKPPLFGDYEAQRHWQEVTTNLATQEWYTNSSHNDMLYWGLDYPPLTAYHSYLVGKMGEALNGSYVDLIKSRGIESNEHKTFMRTTVIASDIFIFLPAVVLLAFTLEYVFKRTELFFFTLVMMLLYPGQILIDNGHFQYNNMSLGLTAFAISAMIKQRFYLSSFLFTLALNYKQMELYHAVPFFVFLLRMCFDQKSYSKGFKKFFIISSIVLFTFLVLWWPWLHSFDSLITVVKRLFPIGRGVFEDKVANFWCAVNVIYKIKNKFSNQQMALLCLVSTLFGILPTCIQLFRKPKRTNFLLCLVNTSMAFFLFSFQVHEKSILLVTLPASSLLMFFPLEVFWFLNYATFSMLPLLLRDGLILPFISTSILYFIAFKLFILRQNKNSSAKELAFYSSHLLMVVVVVVCSTLSPPPKYPFLWPLLISLLSCAHFLLFFLFCTKHQFFYNHTVFKNIYLNKEN